MKTIEYKDKRFMAKFNRYEPLLQDHTAMNIFKLCHRKYFYRIVLGRTLNKQQYQVVLDFGQAVHTFEQILETSKGDVQAAMKAALAMKIDVPEPSSPAYKFRFLNKERLTRTIALAFQVWETDQEQKRIEVISVEEPINVQLPDGSFMSGRPDKVVKWNGKIWDMDHKTTSKEKRWFEAERDPNDQATRYIYMLSKLHGEVIGGIIYNVYYNINEPEEDKKRTKGKDYGPSWYRLPISKTPAQLKEFENEQIQINRQLAINRELDIWPKHETGCKFCEYKWVCRQTTESGQMAKLESDFVLKPWNHEAVEQEVLDDN